MRNHAYHVWSQSNFKWMCHCSGQGYWASNTPAKSYTIFKALTLARFENLWRILNQEYYVREITLLNKRVPYWFPSYEQVKMIKQQ